MRRFLAVILGAVACSESPRAGIDAGIVALDNVVDGSDRDAGIADGCMTGFGASDTSAPIAPREVNARATSSDTVELFWFPSRDNVGICYRIYRARVTSWAGQSYPATWTTPQVVGTSPIDGIGRVAFLDMALQPQTDYIYWVAAVDPAGNESARVTTPHAAPTTLSGGSTITTQVTHPASVTVGSALTITQTIQCSPDCQLGHHDVHWGTSMNSLPSAAGDNFTTHSVQDGAIVATRTSTLVLTTAGPGNIYFMEDGHVVGAGFPLNGGCASGCQPHKEGMLFRAVVTSGNPLTIDPAAIPSGTVGAAYAQPMTASGEGNGTYAWGINEGFLPPGLTISSAGSVVGTPTLAGSYTFSIMVEDSQGTTAFRTYTLAIQ